MARTVGALRVCARSWAGSRGSAQRTFSGAGPVVSGPRLEIAQLALPSNRCCVVDGLGAAGMAVEGDVWADHGGEGRIVDGSTLYHLWCTDSYISGAVDVTDACALPCLAVRGCGERLDRFKPLRNIPGRVVVDP